MAMYRCELIGPAGQVEQSFFREGDSKAAVLEVLESFSWGVGEWSIVEYELDFSRYTYD